MKKTLKNLFAITLVSCCLSALSAEGVTTASAYFKSVSDNYAELSDYEVNFTLKISNQREASGSLTYKTPSYIRLDYTKPEDQVVCYNGNNLVVYLPDSSIVLQQQAKNATVATAQGLSLMSRYYTVAYEKGQSAVPLDKGSSEMVVKFVLTRKSGAETFQKINIAVSPDTKLIRRMEAETSDGKIYVFNFSFVKLKFNS